MAINGPLVLFVIFEQLNLRFMIVPKYEVATHIGVCTIYISRHLNLNFFYVMVVYDRNHYFGLGPIPKLKPKLADSTFGRYHNRYRNYFLKGKSIHF